MIPMTQKQAAETTGRLQDDIERNGLWIKVCSGCGATVGGSIASYPPDMGSESAETMCCPECGKVNEDRSFRAEFIPAKATG